MLFSTEFEITASARDPKIMLEALGYVTRSCVHDVSARGVAHAGPTSDCSHWIMRVVTRSNRLHSRQACLYAEPVVWRPWDESTMRCLEYGDIGMAMSRAYCLLSHLRLAPIGTKTF